MGAENAKRTKTLRAQIEPRNTASQGLLTYHCSVKKCATIRNNVQAPRR
jgi:hypothetical protein